jgi:hypothetical protein
VADPLLENQRTEEAAMTAAGIAQAMTDRLTEKAEQAKPLIAGIQSLLQRADDYRDRIGIARKQIDADAALMAQLCAQAIPLIAQLDAPLPAVSAGIVGIVPQLQAARFDAKGACDQADRAVAMYGTPGAERPPEVALDGVRIQLDQAEREYKAARQSLELVGARRDAAAAFVAKLEQAKTVAGQHRKVLGDAWLALTRINESLISNAQQLTHASDDVDSYRDHVEKAIEQAGNLAFNDAGRERLAALRPSLPALTIDSAPAQAAQERAAELETLVRELAPVVEKPPEQCKEITSVETKTKQIIKDYVESGPLFDEGQRTLDAARQCLARLAALAGTGLKPDATMAPATTAEEHVRPSPPPSTQPQSSVSPGREDLTKPGAEAGKNTEDGRASGVTAPLSAGSLTSFNYLRPDGSRIEGTCYPAYKAEELGRTCRSYTTLPAVTEGRSLGGNICLHGTVTQYYVNGRKSEQKNFVDGVEEGIRTVWCENGNPRGRMQLRANKWDGSMTWWRCDSGAVSSYKEYRDGQMTVEEEYWDNGQKKSHCEYRGADEKKRSCTFFSSDGKIIR